MRKILAAAIAAVLFAGVAHAADTLVTTSVTRLNQNLGTSDRGQVTVVKATYTADNPTGGTASATLTNKDLRGVCLYQVVIDPGSTGPTNGAWDVTLTDSMNADMLGSTALNLSSSTTATAIPLVGTAYGCRYYDGGTMTLTVAANAVNSATAVIDLYFVRP